LGCRVEQQAFVSTWPGGTGYGLLFRPHFAKQILRVSHFQAPFPPIQTETFFECEESVVGNAWKWALLAAVIEVGTMCSAQPVGFLAAVDARACLMRSYSLVPQPGSASVDPNEPWLVDYGQMNRTSVPNGEVVVSYVAMLALGSAVMVALACLLVLALAGIVVKVQKTPAKCPVSPGSLSQRQLALAAKEFPAESPALYIPLTTSDCPSATPR
jgi:hypothetical protein